MKRFTAILCAALLLISVLSLTACGGSSSGGQDISGTYTLVEMTVDGEDLTEYLSLIGDVTLTVDGSKASLDMAGDITEMTVDTGAQTIKSADGEVSPYTIEGNKLTLEEDSSDTKMVFEKQ